MVIVGWGWKLIDLTDPRTACFSWKLFSITVIPAAALSPQFSYE